MAPKIPAGYESLARQFVFYGEYHSNAVNQWVHILCVPLILWSAFFLLHGVPLPAAAASLLSSLPAPAASAVAALGGGTAALPAAALYAAFYLWLSPLAVGVVAAAAVAALAAAAAAAVAAAPGLVLVGGISATAAVAALHAAAWVAQFVGHGVFEKRAPALLDNLFGAIFMAPLFVGLEVAFKLGGLRALRAAVEPDIAARVRAFQRAAPAAAAAPADADAAATLSPRTTRRARARA